MKELNNEETAQRSEGQATNPVGTADEAAEEKTAVTHDVRQLFEEQWANIGISNDFIFCKVTQDKELLGELLRMVVLELEFRELDIHAQKSVDPGKDIHGVRFDVYATDDAGDAIEFEMQVLNTDNIPRRMHYYGSMVDSVMLDRGVLYSRLSDSYVIIISLFDLFDMGLHKYTFTYKCDEVQGLELPDGTTKIFLNARGTADDVPEKLRAFLDYVDGRPSDDEYVKKVDAAVMRARANKEWRYQYMTLYQRDLENQEIGMEKGIEQGMEKERTDKIAEMLNNGRTVEAIVDFCNYPLELVKKVQESMMVSK
jgi:predicted transposase/invertase (TIGR01784 family)